MKLVFACPTYGPIDPQAARSQRAAIMHAAQHAGVQWLGDQSPDRMIYSVARNRIVQRVLETDADGVFWCDSDVLLHRTDPNGNPLGDADAITRLVLAEKDFITGIYFQRAHPFFPLIAHFDPSGGTGGKGTFHWYTEWPDHAIAPIDGCGFGCVLTSTKLLRAIPEPWFHYDTFSEDFTFCLNAAQAGFQLYVDTGVLCGHLPDPKPITADVFRTAWAADHPSPGVSDHGRV